MKSILAVSVLILALYNEVTALTEINMETYNKRELSVDDTSWALSSSGILKSHTGLGYSKGLNKNLTIVAPNGFGVVASIARLDFRPYCADKLTFYDSYFSTRTIMFCNTHSRQAKEKYPNEKKTFYADSGRLVVSFQTQPGGESTFFYDGFQLTYTAVRRMSPCRPYEFRCANNRCINDFLTCDSHNHCGDASDMKHCRGRVPTGSLVGYIIGGIFLLIAAIMGMIFVCRRCNSSPSVQTVVTSHPPPIYTVNQPPPYAGNNPYSPQTYPQGYTNQTYR